MPMESKSHQDRYRHPGGLDRFALLRAYVQKYVAISKVSIKNRTLGREIRAFTK